MNQTVAPETLARTMKSMRESFSEDDDGCHVNQNPTEEPKIDPKDKFFVTIVLEGHSDDRPTDVVADALREYADAVQERVPYREPEAAGSRAIESFTASNGSVLKIVAGGFPHYQPAA